MSFDVNLKKMKKDVLLLVSGVVILLFAFVFLGGEGIFSKNESMSATNASEVALKYVEDNFTQGKAEVEIAGASEESGVYRVDLSIDGETLSSYISKDGKIFFPEGLLVAESVGGTQQYEQTIGGFHKTEDETCFEDGKPIVYSFTSASCPYCKLQRPILDSVMEKFGDVVVFKDLVDSEEDMDIMLKYGNGGIPMLVAGCNYVRTGANTDGSEEKNNQDIDIISAHICKITNNNPAEVCDDLEELTNQII